MRRRWLVLALAWAPCAVAQQDTSKRAVRQWTTYEDLQLFSQVLSELKLNHPDSLDTLADLAKFPFTTKEDLRANYPFAMFAVPRERIVRVHASSGTTGKSTVVGYTKGDIEVWAEVVARSIRAAGGRPGMKLHNAYGYGLFTGGLGLHYGAERWGSPPSRSRAA